MKHALAIAALLMLSGCKTCDWEANYEKRHEYFVQCMQLAGKQPEHNHEDDNGDLVAACDRVSMYQSQQKVCQ